MFSLECDDSMPLAELFKLSECSKFVYRAEDIEYCSVWCVAGGAAYSSLCVYIILRAVALPLSQATQRQQRLVLLRRTVSTGSRALGQNSTQAHTFSLTCN